MSTTAASGLSASDQQQLQQLQQSQQQSVQQQQQMAQLDAVFNSQISVAKAEDNAGKQVAYTP